jgi:glucose-6-phosphate isomerase
MEAMFRGSVQAYADVARPCASLLLPSVTEHTIGQLLQMLMLATVVEGRLMGVNPYGQPGVDTYRRHARSILRAKADRPDVIVTSSNGEKAPESTPLLQ